MTKNYLFHVCNIKFGKQKKLFVGNLNAKREWGHAEDYVQAMWKMLQFKRPDDFVITGKQYYIRDFIKMVSKVLGMKLRWTGKGINENFLMKNNLFVECRKIF